MKNKHVQDPQKTKKLLVLPLLIIPFLTMAFWALGGGRSNAASQPASATGLNLQLPGAQLREDKGQTKLGYYEQAMKDSAKWKEAADNDPFFSSFLNDSLPKTSFRFNPYPLQGEAYQDPNRQKVYQKLAELNERLQLPGKFSSHPQSPEAKFPRSEQALDRSDLNRLEDLVRTVNTPSIKDPEVEQLNGMMDRIMDIQHPERVKPEEKEYPRKEAVFAVKSGKGIYPVSLLDTAKGNDPAGAFFGVEEQKEDAAQKTMEAVIHQTQSVVDGSIVKMRLLEDIGLNGIIIPAGNFVFGKATLEGERLHIAIHSIRKDNALYAVDLAVYDLDGMEGLHVPGTITSEVARQSADHALQSIEMNAIDPSFKMQAAAAGINAAKSLLTKKTKRISVTVKAGYKVLIRQKTGSE